MTTTNDLIDICSLYYTQTAIWLDIHDPRKMESKQVTREAIIKNSFRAYLYALSVRLILEGAY